MVGPQIIDGSRAPLFDRLSERGALFDPRATVPLDMRGAFGAAPVRDERQRRVLDRDSLIESIVREVDELLNTRTPLAADELDLRPRSTLDYGLPDLSLFWPSDDDSRQRLAGLIERTVAAFEPRLAEPRARVETVPGKARLLRVEISGSVSFERLAEPVTFPILLRDGKGVADDG